MKIYQEAEEVMMAEALENQKCHQKNRDDIDQKSREIQSYLDKILAVYSVEPGLKEDRITIHLTDDEEAAKSPYHKSAIVIYPDRSVYCCGHYSVNRASVNEVLTEKTEFCSPESIKPLLLSDIIKCRRMVDLQRETAERFRESHANELCSIRKKWDVVDFKESYADEWDEVPNTIEECREKMEEYIFHTYSDEYIVECIIREK